MVSCKDYIDSKVVSGKDYIDSKSPCPNNRSPKDCDC